MYVPGAFRVDDVDKLTEFVQRHSFATLVTQNADGPFATHLPTLYDRERGAKGTLVAHMARANSQWRHLASGNQALAIFHGPHGYVSPSWYRSHPAVPTWNYAVVHAYGVPAVIEDGDRVIEFLDRTVAWYEAAVPNPWLGAPADYRDKLVEAIVAFEMPIDRLEGKFKLSQNRSGEDREGVYEALSRAPDAASRGVAELMLSEGLVKVTSLADLPCDR